MLEPKVIQYLGKIHKPESMDILFELLKDGKFSKETTVVTMLQCVEGFYSPTKKESEQIREMLTDLIEYIEVTELRGGIAAHAGKESKYPKWKGIQARAGSAMLKFHKPKARAIVAFDDADLDI